MSRMKTEDPAAVRASEVGNRFGHFSADGTEFCITDPATPRPWVNIISNPRIGLAVSQTGSGFTWIENSQLAVITRWQQDLRHDSSGKFLYVRDLDSDEVWSLSPAPTSCQFKNYTCRHGLGYTTFELEYAGIRSEWTLFCHTDLPAELWQVHITNLTDQPRRLELCSYLEWNCGITPSPRREFGKLFIETEFDGSRGAILARNHMWEVPSEQHGHWNTCFPFISAFAGTEPVLSAQGDNASFVGCYNDLKRPEALCQDVWKPQFGRHEDPIAAIRCTFPLRPLESREAGYVLAMEESSTAATDLLSNLCQQDVIGKSLEKVKASWHDRLAKSRIETPDASWNHLANDWLRYQAISSRIWGRCGYYQQSGAYGFRDQLQDSQIWLGIDPHKCKEQISLHAAHQFSDGSVYHWWHPLSEQGLTTKMTDDLLWLGFVTANYIKQTGDFEILQATAPFLDDQRPSSLRDHIDRAFGRVFDRTSPRGLPYIGAGDWNDGLSGVGLNEKGESIWLAQFLAGLLAEWSQIYRRTGDEHTALEFDDRRETLVSAINTHGWDGSWYSRATLDDGTILGSAQNRVGQIFLNAQTWAVLNDVAPPDRAALCMEAVREHLVSEAGALLLAPAFDTPVPEIGYITRYAPGLRENGGVYTHAATWAIAAACKVGDAQLVDRLLKAINPTNKNPDKYWAEPYVTPGNVDGPDSPHFGRGGWTWYTGSATWLHRVMTHWVLGVRPEWDGLRIAPCMPPSWDRASLTCSYRGHTYDVSIQQHKPRSDRGKVSVEVDGRQLPSNLIQPPSAADVKRHEVRVMLS